jgi:hypothetical protein
MLLMKGRHRRQRVEDEHVLRNQLYRAIPPSLYERKAASTVAVGPGLRGEDKNQGPGPATSLCRRKPVSKAPVSPGLHRDGVRGGRTKGRSLGARRLVEAVAGAALVLAAASADADQSDMIKEPIAVLQGLDKITARVSEITAPVGKPVQFGTLRIMVRDCEKNPPEDRPEDAAFLQIDEVRPGEENVRRFSGWMFAQSPALSSLEHPVYDVILLDCEGAASNASGSPPAASGSSSGKDAR